MRILLIVSLFDFPGSNVALQVFTYLTGGCGLSKLCLF